MAAYTASQVTISNGSKAVVINSNENPESVSKGDFLFLSGSDPKEINRTYINDQQKHVIELVENWDSGNKTNQPAIVLPTTVEFRDTVAAIKNANLLINDNMQAMSDWQSKLGTVTFIGLDGTERTVPTLASFLATLGTAATKDVTTSPTDTTAGRLLKVGYMGLGDTSGIEQSDLDLIVRNGWHYNLKYSIDGSVDGVFQTVTSMGDNANQGFQLGAFGAQGDGSEGNTYSRRKWQGGWREWRKIYDSGNTNFNEFGGQVANDTIGIAGRITNATGALFLPINSNTAPTSITSTGSFNIIRNGINEGAITSLTLTSGSSNKVAILEFGGVIFNQGDFIQVRTAEVTSKITVNF